MGDGSWEREDGSWKMGVGRWELGDGSWEMGDGRWEMEVGRWEMGDFGANRKFQISTYKNWNLEFFYWNFIFNSLVRKFRPSYIGHFHLRRLRWYLN